jgi:DNA-binding CsgD family transcriptional regulator
VSGEAQAPRLPVLDGGAARPGPAAGRLISRAAELVVLAEELYLRLFVLALVFVLVSSLVSIWFAADSSAPLAVTLPFSVAAAAWAVTGLRFPRRLYGWLRYSEWRQVAPALLGAVAMVPTGPDSPLWWPALALVILVAAVSSLRLSLAAAVLSAAGYVAGTVIAGGAIIRGGQAGILAGAVGFVAYTLVGSFVCEAFARFVLGFERLERLERLEERQPAEGHGDGEPRRVASVVLAQDASPRHAAPLSAPAAAPARAPTPGPAGHRAGSSLSLTPRQLEVALLVRDGLNQSETAASLGISRRQVERLLGEARARAGAATTSHLMAMLVACGDAP